MTRTALHALREIVSDQVAVEGLRPLANRLKLDVGAIRGVMECRNLTHDTIEALARSLNLEFYIGPPRQSGASSAVTPPDWTILGSMKAPHRGIERCNGSGWGKDVSERDPLPLPQAADDPKAFWVTATGNSMMPEGIESGWLCLVSPAAQPVPGDRIWVRNTSGTASIKRLVSIEDDGALRLRNWKNRRAGEPKSFEEKRFPADIERVHPVVAVFRGRPGGEHFEHVPDPAAPDLPPAMAPPELTAALGLPEDTSMAEAVAAIEERLKHAGGDTGDAAAVTKQMEALRADLKAQMAAAVREGLADATALANNETDPPEERPVAVVELASVAGGGTKSLSEEVSGRLWFRRAWLDEHGLYASHCAVIGVMGDAMEPTLMDGAKILIDRTQTDWRAGGIFVIQAPGGLLVRRAGEDAKGKALMLGDNPSWKTAAWPDGAQVLGRVVWTARTLVGE